MRQSRKRSGCLKGGCFGCAIPVLGVMALLVVVTVSQLARDSGGRRQENRDLVRELPPLPSLEDLLESGELLEMQLPLLDPGLLESRELAPRVGRVVLDLNVGEFKIRAGAAGEPIRVDADFEADAFELRESFTENEEGGFVYEISFKPKGGIFGMMFRGAGNNPRNEIEIILPRDRPFDLVGELGLGESRVDLGGLWLREVDLTTGTGEHVIEVSEPLVAPMSSMRIKKSTGELRLVDLGNASPRELFVEMRIGELFVDLSGQPWSIDSKIEVDFGVGESRIRLPEGARIVVERASVAIGEDGRPRIDNEGIPENAPTVTLDLQAKIGELKLVR